LKKILSLLVVLFFISPALALSPADKKFQAVWDPFWTKKLPATARYQAFRASGDTKPGFRAARVNIDVNYQVLSNNKMPEVDILVPKSWEDRDAGKVWQGRVHMPYHFVLPDANASETPNNPMIILNDDTKKAVFLNAAARPKAGGPVWGYKSDTKAITHGGSGLAGGEVMLSELQQGYINHALAINVWGAKYLSHTNGGFVPPADRADDGYNNPTSSNYYGGKIPGLTMGTRLAIPPGITPRKLGITSQEGLILYRALRNYGAYIVDNSGWNVLYLNATPETVPVLMRQEADMARLFSALHIVK
jgi:hypothetical protein